MDLERTFLSNLPMIDTIIRITSTRHGFRNDDLDEFTSYVRLKFIEDGYGILRKFSGRSQLRTYLVTVIQRLALDFKLSRTGKWRPSAEAQRHGDHAVELETLMHRDQLPQEEAFQILLHRHPELSRNEVEKLVAVLPNRPGRPVQAELDESLSHPGSDSWEISPEQKVLARKLEAAILSTFETFNDEERLILKLRFESDCTIPEIAQATKLRSKPLYQRIEKLLRRLRASLQHSAFTDMPSDTETLAKMVHLSFETGRK